VEYEDPRDAEDALGQLDGIKIDGAQIAVEYSNSTSNNNNNSSGRERRPARRGGHQNGGRVRNPYSRFSPPRNSEYRLLIDNLPSNCSWKELKDHFRCCGDVCFSDVRKDKSGKEYGIVEYKFYDDMKKAARDLDRSSIRGATIYIEPYNNQRGGSPPPLPPPREYLPRVEHGMGSPREFMHRRESPPRGPRNEYYYNNSPPRHGTMNYTNNYPYSPPRRGRSTSPPPNPRYKSPNRKYMEQNRYPDDYREVREPRSPLRKTFSQERHRSNSPSRPHYSNYKTPSPRE